MQGSQHGLQPLTEQNGKRPSAERSLCLSALHRSQVYLFERTPGGEWAQSVALSPTSALSEATGQAGKLSAAFKDKLALFKGHTSHVGNPCHVVCISHPRPSPLRNLWTRDASGSPQGAAACQL